MNKLKFIGILLVAIVLAFSGCDALVANLSDELIAAQNDAVGTGSIDGSTFTYNYVGKSKAFNGWTGETVAVKFSQPVSILMDGTNAKDKVTVELTYVQDGITKTSKVYLNGAGTLSADGLTYTFSLDNVFSAIKLNTSTSDPANTFEEARTDDGCVTLNVKVENFLSKTEKDAVGAFRPIPAVTKKITVQPAMPDSGTYYIVTGAKNAANTYSVTLPAFSSPVTVEDLAAFTITDSSAAKADYTLTLGDDGKTLTLSLVAPAGTKTDVYREITLGIPGLAFDDDLKSTDITFTRSNIWILPAVAAWIKHADVGVVVDTVGGSSDAAYIQANVNVTNLVAPDGLAITMAGTKLFSAPGTEVSWNNGALDENVASGAVTIAMYFQKDSGFGGWGRTWMDLSSMDATFAIVVDGTWERIVGCWEDKKQPQDGNFFIDFDAKGVAVGDLIDINLDCSKATAL